MTNHGNEVREEQSGQARYLDAMMVSTPTRKLHLAALRRFFDELVMRHVVILNPALSVRTELHQAVEGKTPEISVQQARRLLNAIDWSPGPGSYRDPDLHGGSCWGCGEAAAGLYHGFSEKLFLEKFLPSSVTNAGLACMGRVEPNINADDVGQKQSG